MNRTADLLNDINVYLIEECTDKRTIEFLLNLKRKILELDEKKLSIRQRKIELSHVETLLRTVGKKAFISCYDKLKEALNGKFNNISDSMKDCLGEVSPNSARTKSSVGIRIFKEGLEIEALKTIINANKVDEETKIVARKILEKETRL